MTERIIDISSDPARLHLNNGCLVLERNESAAVTVPLAEVGVVVLSHPHATCTGALLAGLAEAGAFLVFCDDRHLPAGMMLPLRTHHVQVERFTRQAAASLPTKKRLWQRVVRAKVRAQARLLTAVTGADHGLGVLGERVRSGDPVNVEAQASRRYWPVLMGADFHRDPALEDANRYLNYGYAILRAIVARAICAAGLHPSLGVHHHNRSNAFCLADDLMEPMRPVVDRVVLDLVRSLGPTAPLERPVKAKLIEPLLGKFESDGESRSLFDLSARSASSLAGVFMGESEDLFLPEV